MTKITAEEIRLMEDNDLLKHLHRFPYFSQYEDKEAYRIAEYRLALIQGNRYMETGNVKALFTR